MTDAELSRDLALALGYFPESVNIELNACVVYRIPPHCTTQDSARWLEFNYRDADVVLPLIEWIGERYRIFFWWCRPTDKRGPLWSSSNGGIAPTLAEAVARAVIATKGKP